MDRDCDKCVYHTSGSCSKWECDFTTISDIRNKTIDDFIEFCRNYATVQFLGTSRECDLDKIDKKNEQESEEE